MIVYKDRISGDELFTDAYKFVEEGVFYKVFGKTKTEKSKDDYDIGGNPSAEEAAETTEGNEVSGCDIVIANRLKETSFTKKSYKPYIGTYMKSILALLPEEKQASFKTEMTKVVKEFVLFKFDDWQFFQGESMDPDAMAALMEYVTDPVTNKPQPYMLFFKDGIIEEKQ